MNEPSLEQLDTVRKEGYRPGIVACIIHDKKILMFYKVDHKLWQLPQGRISNKESAQAALKRNLIEELGKTFVEQLDFSNVSYVDADRMEFKPGRHEVEELQDDSGKVIPMLGKEYTFCVINSKTTTIATSETQFDQCFWMSFREAYFIADRIYQKGKRRITIKILTALQSSGLIE